MSHQAPSRRLPGKNKILVREPALWNDGCFLPHKGNRTTTNDHAFLFVNEFQERKAVERIQWING